MECFAVDATEQSECLILFLLQLFHEQLKSEILISLVLLPEVDSPCFHLVPIHTNCNGLFHEVETGFSKALFDETSELSKN